MRTLRVVLFCLIASLVYGQGQTQPTKAEFDAAGAHNGMRYRSLPGPLNCMDNAIAFGTQGSYDDPATREAIEKSTSRFTATGRMALIEHPGEAACLGKLENAVIVEIKNAAGIAEHWMLNCRYKDQVWANRVKFTDNPPPATPQTATPATPTIIVTQGQQANSDVDQLIKLKMLQLLQEKPATPTPTTATVDLTPLLEAEKERLRIEAEQLKVQQKMAGSLVWANRINGVNAGLNLGQFITGIVTMNRVGETNKILTNGFNNLGQQIAKQPPMAITLTQTVGDVMSGSNPQVSTSTPTNIQNGQSQGQGTQVTANPQANGGAITGSANPTTTANGGTGGSGAMNPVLQGGQGGNGGSGGIGLGGYGGGGESSSSSTSSGTTSSGASSTGASATSQGASATTGPSSSTSGSQAGATTGTVTANGTGNGGQATTGPVTSGSAAGSTSGVQGSGNGVGTGGNAGASSGSQSGSQSGATGGGGGTATTGPVSSGSQSGSQSGATGGGGGSATTGPVSSGSQSGSQSGAAAGATNAPSTTNNNNSGSQSGANAGAGANSGSTATQTTPPPAGGGGGN